MKNVNSEDSINWLNSRRKSEKKSINRVFSFWSELDAEYVSEKCLRYLSLSTKLSKGKR